MPKSLAPLAGRPSAWARKDATTRKPVVNMDAASIGQLYGPNRARDKIIVEPGCSASHAAAHKHPARSRPMKKAARQASGQYLMELVCVFGLEDAAGPTETDTAT